MGIGGWGEGGKDGGCVATTEVLRPPETVVPSMDGWVRPGAITTVGTVDKMAAYH